MNIVSTLLDKNTKDNDWLFLFTCTHAKSHNCTQLIFDQSCRTVISDHQNKKEHMMNFKGLKRQTSQASMCAFGSGVDGSEVFDRQGPAASRLERQESMPVNQLVSL